MPDDGSDTISWLAREFNAMADSVTGLLGEVRSQREWLETVINSIDDGIVVLDGARTVVAANDAFLASTDGRREALVGCCCDAGAGGACQMGGPCPTMECLKSGQRQVRLCEHVRADGSIRWEEVHASPIAGDGGRVAAADSAVLVTGETGSGKEIVARLVHSRSPRREKPFAVVDCTALQESVLQSELFGHERGAFTGADRAKPGLFEVAHGGTIFLDEIGEVSLPTQVKLLRVLDTSTFRRVGGTAEIRVDVRLVAATNRDLAAMVR